MRAAAAVSSASPAAGLETIRAGARDGRRERGRERRATARPCVVERRVAAPAVPMTRPGRARVTNQDESATTALGRRIGSTGPDTAADSNVAIPSRTRDRGRDQAHGQRRPGPLAEPQVEVEQRREAEVLEDDRVARARWSGGRRSAAARRPAGGPRATSAAEPVMKPSSTTGMPGTTALRRSPDERRDLEPADARPGRRAGRSGPGAFARERALDGGDLVPPAVASSMPVPRPVTASATGAGEDRRDGAGRRRVADAHLADPEQVEAPLGDAASATSSRPTAIAASASSRDIAGSTVMSAVPSRIRARTRRAATASVGRLAGSGCGRATPDVDDDDPCAPTAAARTLMAAPPATKLATIWAVTSDG